ncbi:hypothetical protein COW36_08480 [bacterium (Candidatus Blackallbacteria) CG17_big_fil_post_rev_8_21_14_2_50_48_46]|uniref:Glycosyltransferase 2-like domain-containing protein n=1 Tax=bacterium (Candidatus Blackallbacteria) CG17_big_fil_post_rev_8_21_14_2_50_48_46 TaxID=2014261 RepID=A0A2M7G6J0_9BACT|nr:MAG: hypothetical protein COW64_05780 [bacterium (Candidatus Blackallbacteria) CG18_big_fil_WC_8_21_14_2_50_49_26]PIW17523.1 MAG: hypothetical protein COW36_08480 [bacterium (Candidatus Blackallbacteria) CG17_big_fil_post_rev_8_21_14_2_50_48_46]PIW48377.1 MAG: hypothetical protein COW20_09830 [bacterium (Candidatus Blackallbacteria) CG13_big_fil_rev_8_21_14_2_50_49_14]
MAASPSQTYLDLCRQWLASELDDFEKHWHSALGEQTRLELQKPGQARLKMDVLDLLKEAYQQISERAQAWPAHVVFLLTGRKHVSLDSIIEYAPQAFETWVSDEFSQTSLITWLSPVSSSQVTILIPTYNRLPLLQRSVQSVLAQSHSDWKLIIGDDGSSDGTQIWCEMLAASDSRIAYIRKAQNSGVYDTMGMLYQACESEWVMSLADDDCLMPNCLESTVKLFEQFPWIAMAGGGYYYLHFKGTQLRLKQYGPYYSEPCLADTRKELQRCGLINPIFGGGALFRKAQLFELSAADPEALGHGFSSWDWLLTAEFLSHYEVGYAPEITVAYIDHEQGEHFNQSRNWGQPFLALLERILGRYESLFGQASYPREIIEYFMLAVAEPYLTQAFQETLSSHQTPEEMDAFIQAQRPVWELHRKLRLACYLSERKIPALIQADTVAGLTQGEIPGLKAGAAPIALQRLLASFRA